MIPSNLHSSSKVTERVSVDPTAQIGPNCYLDGGIVVEAGVVLIGGITLIGNIVIGRNSLLEPGVCIAATVTSKGGYTDMIRVGNEVHIGAGTVLLDGVTIGNHAWINPGTVVLKNIPPHAIVGGNPATITGYRDEAIQQSRVITSVAVTRDTPGVYPSHVQGVTIHQFARIPDLRGDLTVGEFERNVPFLPRRYFIVYDVPSTETRGEHAHKRCHQFLICVAGAVSVVVDDGIRREEILLDQPNVGLFIPAGIWGVQYKYSINGTLLVFASEYYDAADYIRNYEEFLDFRGVTV